MSKASCVTADGVILESLSNGMFKVELDNGHTLTCTIAGKLRIHYIKIIPGDRVRVEISPYDLTHGRISYRYK